MKKKIINTSTSSKPVSKGAVAILAYGNDNDDPALDWVEFRTYPTADKQVMRHGHEFVEWCKTVGSATKPMAFFRAKGIDRDTVSRWRKRLTEFDRLYRFGLEEIGDRREDLVDQKKMSEQKMLRTMAIYDPDYKDLIRWQSELTTRSDAAKAHSDAQIITEAVKTTLHEFDYSEKKEATNEE